MADNLWTITYELRPDAPSPMDWEEYRERVLSEWNAVLSDSTGERPVQRFLEQHPCLVPGAWMAYSRLTSGHGPFPYALITQPTLRGLTARTPDFLWIARDSSYLTPVFVELEDPSKRWVTLDGKQHSDLTHALDQIREWRRWLREPVHQQWFWQYYGIPDVFRDREFRPLFILVHGRNTEDPKHIAKLRADLRTDDQWAMTYDHVEPVSDSRDFPCVRKTDDAYVAVTIPPTMRLRPGCAEDWSRIKGRADAAARSVWLSPERREFLAERFPYWDNWSRNGGRTFRSSDWE